MAEMLNVRIVNTGEELVIPDVEPTEAAKLFWQISDEIWRQRPEGFRPKGYSRSYFDIPSTMPVMEARDTLNEALSEIDEGLIFSGVGRAVTLLGGGPPAGYIKLTPELLDNPATSCVGTYNWDGGDHWRYAVIDGKKELIEFTDDHKDRFRELYAGFNYRDKKSQIVRLTYSMLRLQGTQDHDDTSLAQSFWNNQCVKMGADGSYGNYRGPESPLTTEQELRVLRVFQAMGGISLEATPQE